MTDKRQDSSGYCSRLDLAKASIMAAGFLHPNLFSRDLRLCSFLFETERSRGKGLDLLEL